MAFLVPIFVRHSSFTPRLVQKPLLQRRWSERRARTIVAQAGTPIRNNPKLGFIGMGVMGLPMLSNLSKSFPDLVVWNRSDKREEVDSAIATSAKLRIAKTPAEVVSEADITFSMLSTPEAVRSVFYDHDSSALSSISPGKSLIDCSTLQISDMVETARIVSERGGSFLEAPVSGSKVPAEQGQLIFLCGGDKNLFDDPVSQTAFDLMGKKAFYLGDVGNGTKMKVPYFELFLLSIICVFFAWTLSALLTNCLLLDSLFLLHWLARCQSAHGHHVSCSE